MGEGDWSFFYLNGGSCPLLRGDNNEITKIHCRLLKLFFPKITVWIFIKLGTEHTWVIGIQVYIQIEGYTPFQRVIEAIFIGPAYIMIANCSSFFFFCECFSGKWCGPWVSWSFLSLYLCLSLIFIWIVAQVLCRPLDMSICVS